MSAGELLIRPLRGLPEVREGDALGPLVVESAAPGSDEIVVLSQKVVSKAEGRLLELDRVDPGHEARELADRIDKEPRLVQLILDESRAVIRATAGVLIVETRGGLICANAGIDSSNVEEGFVALLPSDPDDSARRIRREIQGVSGSTPALIVADSFGRPWRLGQTDVAIGCAGIAALEDWRGRLDRNRRELSATVIASADEIAAAADLVRSKDSGVPGAVVAGLDRLVTEADGPGAVALRRPEAEDLFR